MIHAAPSARRTGSVPPTRMRRESLMDLSRVGCPLLIRVQLGPQNARVERQIARTCWCALLSLVRLVRQQIAASQARAQRAARCGRRPGTRASAVSPWRSRRGSRGTARGGPACPIGVAVAVAARIARYGQRPGTRASAASPWPWWLRRGARGAARGWARIPPAGSPWRSRRGARGAARGWASVPRAGLPWRSVTGPAVLGHWARGADSGRARMPPMGRRLGKWHRYTRESRVARMAHRCIMPRLRHLRNMPRRRHTTQQK